MDRKKGWLLAKTPPNGTKTGLSSVFAQVMGGTQRSRVFSRGRQRNMEKDGKRGAYCVDEHTGVHDYALHRCVSLSISLNCSSGMLSSSSLNSPLMLSSAEGPLFCCPAKSSPWLPVSNGMPISLKKTPVLLSAPRSRALPICFPCPCFFRASLKTHRFECS